MRGRIAHLSASLAILDARWGEPCRIARDFLRDGWCVAFVREGQFTPLGGGKTPEDAVTAALALWPACAYCGGGVTEEAKEHAWPMCGQCPDTQLPGKWETKGEAA